MTSFLVTFIIPPLASLSSFIPPVTSFSFFVPSSTSFSFFIPPLTIYPLPTSSMLAHTKLDGVDRYPTTSSSRRCNVERAIDFLKLEGISFQGDPAKGKKGQVRRCRELYVPIKDTLEDI